MSVNKRRDVLNSISIWLRSASVNIRDPSLCNPRRLSRYTHETKTPNRIESGLRFDGVMSVSSQGVAKEKGEAFAVVLGLEFKADDSPAGQFYLKLAGGGLIRIAVEGIDVTLADHGELRPTKRIPKHDG